MKVPNKLAPTQHRVSIDYRHHEAIGLLKKIDKIKNSPRSGEEKKLLDIP